MEPNPSSEQLAHQDAVEARQDAADARQDAADARQDAADAREQTTANDTSLREMVGSLAITVDKISVNLNAMIEDSKLSRQAMKENTAALKRSKKENRLLRTALISSLVLFVGGAFVVWRDHDETSCVKAWAVGTSDRSTALSGPAAARVTDLYGALGAASGGALRGVGALPSHAAEVDFVYKAKARYPLLVPGTKADLAKENTVTLHTSYYLIRGLDANSAYISGTVDHPIPQSPFRCSSF